MSGDLWKLSPGEMVNEIERLQEEVERLHTTDPDTVTITISREDAEAFQDPDGNWVNGSTERLAASCRAALEAQHEYDNSPELQALLRRAAGHHDSR